MSLLSRTQPEGPFPLLDPALGKPGRSVAQEQGDWDIVLLGDRCVHF